MAAEEKGMGLLMALGKPKAEGESEEVGDELMGETDDAEMMAAQDVLDAIASKDASALKAALAASYAACAGKKESEEDLY